MSQCVIKLPEVFSTEKAQTTFSELESSYKLSFSKEIERVIFDFSECTSISPVGLIYIRIWRDRLIECGKKTYYRKSNPETDSFLKRMHLLPHTEADEQAVHEKFFYHIHHCNNIYECSAAHRDIVANVVSRGKVPEETYCAVDYMINELWDNAGVHGYECYNTENYPKPVYICALEHDTYYEVCIGDQGQGIYNSLQKNNNDVRGRNKKDSVKAAIQNGISGHPNGSPGFGLYSAAEFIRGGNGTLYLWSSGCYLLISSKADRIYNSSITNGTLVSFVINKDAVIPFEDTLNAQSRYPRSTSDYIEEVIGGLFDEL